MLSREYAALVYLLEQNSFPVTCLFATKNSDLERTLKARSAKGLAETGQGWPGSDLPASPRTDQRRWFRDHRRRLNPRFPGFQRPGFTEPGDHAPCQVGIERESVARGG